MEHALKKALSLTLLFMERIDLHELTESLLTLENLGLTTCIAMCHQPNDTHTPTGCNSDTWPSKFSEHHYVRPGTTTSHCTSAGYASP